MFHPATTQYTFFSAVHGTFSKIDILGHKPSLNKYKKTAIKLELNNIRNSRKYSNTWSPNNTLLHDQWVIEKIWRK
jgi:hypothetical protein